MDKKRVQTLKEIDSNDLKEYREKKWNKGIREEYREKRLRLNGFEKSTERNGVD